VAAKIQSRANSGEIAFSARVHQMCVETQNEILKFPIEKRTDSRDFIGPADIYVVRIDADNSYPSRDES
jgi:class 3 adenylate cyclase